MEILLQNAFTYLKMGLLNSLIVTGKILDSIQGFTQCPTHAYGQWKVNMKIQEAFCLCMGKQSILFMRRMVFVLQLVGLDGMMID